LESAESATDNQYIDLVGEGFSFDRLVEIGVVHVVAELALNLNVLLVAIGTQAFLTFCPVSLAKGLGIEFLERGIGGGGCCVFGCTAHD
jgi:hypothetical protein